MREPDEWVNFGDKDQLRVMAKVSTPTGWLNLNDGGRYRLEASALAEQSATFRRREIQSPHLPGTWLVSAVPENITEPVSIWVNEFDHYALHKALQALRDAFTQAYYVMHWQIEQHEFAWNCQLADYQIDSSKDLRHATMAKFTARVPRHPEVVNALAGILPRPAGGQI